MGRILAIDYGQKRVGLAVTDEYKIIATALDTVPVHEIFSYLEAYFRQENVECVVIGEPKQLNNTASESVRFIDPFVRKFKKVFKNMKVERYDERFTSKMAQQTMIDAGLKKKDRQNKSTVDKISAVLILQSFLNAQNSKLKA
jgi:putative Holliday junction resolvase